MSEENVQVVRQPIAVRTRSRRSRQERLALRFPGVLAFLIRAILRLPPRSRLRQAVIRRTIQRAWEAVNRGDHEATFALHDAAVEMIPPPVDSLGFDRVLYGREERVRFQQRWLAEWREFRFEPEELIDLGDRVLVLGRMRGSGLSSGAPIENELAYLATVSVGRVTHEQFFGTREEALEAAGLGE